MYAAAAAVFLLALFTNAAYAGSGMDQRTKACHATLYDHQVIAMWRLKGGEDGKGGSKEEIVESAKTSTKLPDARRPKALELIEEAYAAPDVKKWFHGYWDRCMGEQSTSENGAFLRVKGQKMHCEVIAAASEAIERDSQSTEFRPEHYVNQPWLARAVDRCIKAGEKVRACVIRRCLGSSV